MWLCDFGGLSIKEDLNHILLTSKHFNSVKVTFHFMSRCNKEHDICVDINPLILSPCISLILYPSGVLR